MLHIAKKCKIILSMLALIVSLPISAATDDLPDKDWMNKNDYKVLIALDSKGVAKVYEYGDTSPVTGKKGKHDKCDKKDHNIPSACLSTGAAGVWDVISYQIAPGNVTTGSLGLPSMISPAYAGGNCIFISGAGGLYKICY